MKEKCVSVIVPVYNSVQYLEQCIESIINQTYKNIQILLVDDGSTDGTDKICDTYRKKDSRIEVYHTDNLGVSSARNIGLKNVVGQYVVFVDGDDYIQNNYVKAMVDEIEKTNSDMVICRYLKELKGIKVPCKRIDNMKKYSGGEYLENTLKDAGHHYYGVVWNKIYKTEIISKKNITFRTDVNLGEDFIFNIEYWQECRLVCILQKALYYYNKYSEGMSQTQKRDIDNCINELNCRKKIYEVYKKAFERLDLFDKNKEEILFYLVGFYIGQNYDLKNTYIYWNEEDKIKWKQYLDNDEQINFCKNYISEKKMKSYFDSYLKLAKKKKILDVIKKIIGEVHEKGCNFNNNK